MFKAANLLGKKKKTLGLVRLLQNTDPLDVQLQCLRPVSVTGGWQKLQVASTLALSLPTPEHKSSKERVLINNLS